MIRMRNRFLLLSYGALLAVFAVMGCTSKEDPSEVLSVCGNHSCGDLAMVTTDTSSDGYHYLNPSLSPDEDQILFTADWWAIPTDPRYDGDDPFVNRRQLIFLPYTYGYRGTEPVQSLQQLGAELMVLREFGLNNVGGQGVYYLDARDMDKGGPTWATEDTVIFWMTLRVGNRLFRAGTDNLPATTVEPLYMEASDGRSSPPYWQHMEPTLSPDKRWLAFTRSGCAIPDSFETCTGLSIWVLDMWTAGIDEGYGAKAFPITNEYSRIETPRWSPNGRQIVFSGGMDVDGGTGVGTEVFTMDFDAAALAAGDTTLDRGFRRVTYTTRAEGDPITGIYNTAPVFSNDMGTIYFVSTRRAPSITLHDRNVWRVPADGSRDPEIYFFTRSDDVDPYIMPNGNLLLSSTLGFTTEMLADIEARAYEQLLQDNETRDPPLTEVQMRAAAAETRSQVEFFEGVMSHLYVFRP
jgi:hypothetical protein